MNNDQVTPDERMTVEAMIETAARGYGVELTEAGIGFVEDGEDVGLDDRELLRVVCESINANPETALDRGDFTPARDTVATWKRSHEALQEHPETAHGQWMRADGTIGVWLRTERQHRAALWCMWADEVIRVVAAPGHPGRFRVEAWGVGTPW